MRRPPRADWPAASRAAGAPGGCRSPVQPGAVQLVMQHGRNLLGEGLGVLLGEIGVRFMLIQQIGDTFVTEDTTNVMFPREVTVPGYTHPLVAVGTGYREKFFVKVYAAAFYVDYSLRLDTEQWKAKTGIESFDSSSVFDSIFKAPVVKSLSIILVRAVDGKTFVNALNDVIARQIKNPNAEEESSLSTLQNTFLGRNLKQGTSIYLTWLEPKRMLISISEDEDPRQVDAEIKSATVNYALYDGFFGKSTVCPSLRSSTAQLLDALLLAK
ncbi:Chalcone isomerase 3 [Zea mays]|uniref:Chalcone-flavonone isomerase family protein n=3 Tax=Zea mays TaxID=4577 RepID=A0A1D6H5M2_MAIZE|nr:Chalcone isomerase 3 [Zea mays]